MASCLCDASRGGLRRVDTLIRLRLESDVPPGARGRRVHFRRRGGQAACGRPRCCSPPGRRDTGRERPKRGRAPAARRGGRVHPTRTLLHDDVVDMSELRRGRATANAELSNAAAVLVGDFPLPRAPFQMRSRAEEMRVMRVLSGRHQHHRRGRGDAADGQPRPGGRRAEYLEVVRRRPRSCSRPRRAWRGARARAGPALEEGLPATACTRHAFQLIDACSTFGRRATIGKEASATTSRGQGRRCRSSALLRTGFARAGGAGARPPSSRAAATRSPASCRRSASAARFDYARAAAQRGSRRRGCRAQAPAGPRPASQSLLELASFP